MHPLARARHLLARRPWLYWLAAGILAVAAGLVAARAGASVDDARRSWGETRQVVVARTDLAPGERLDGHVEVRPRPAPMVPADAVATVTASARARQHVAAGEILVAGDVAPTGVPQALIPPGWTAIAIAEAVPSGARVGDAVGVAASGAVLSAEGIVVGLVGDATLVAVPDRRAAAVAGASAAAGVSLLLHP